MKKICMLAAALACCAVTLASAYNPYAPNQFDTMERNTWEYQYVYDLSKDGLTGASMAVFEPSYQLTRYEMSTYVAQAIRRRARANAEDQTKIDKLAQAFENDLKYVDENGESDKTVTITMPEGQPFDWKGDK